MIYLLNRSQCNEKKKLGIIISFSLSIHLDLSQCHMHACVCIRCDSIEQTTSISVDREGIFEYITHKMNNYFFFAIRLGFELTSYVRIIVTSHYIMDSINLFLYSTCCQIFAHALVSTEREREQVILL